MARAQLLDEIKCVYFIEAKLGLVVSSSYTSPLNITQLNRSGVYQKFYLIFPCILPIFQTSFYIL